MLLSGSSDFRRVSIVRFVRILSLKVFGGILLLAAIVNSLPVMRGAEGGAMPGANGKWRHYSSPHFELYSRNADKASRELLYNFELVRAVFLDRLKLEPRLQVDVTVYFFGSERDFQSYLPPRLRGGSTISGFHLFQPDRAVISMAPARDKEAAQQTVFHEYVHHLFRITERNPALWFNEGTADVFAGMRVDGKRVQIGTPLENSALYLQQETLIPLDQLFAGDKSSRLYKDENHTGIFYAESWALLHYLHFGKTSFSKQAVDRFLRVAGNLDAATATDLRALFKSCFGCDYPDMLRQLKEYIRSGSYRAGYHPMPVLEPSSGYLSRAVPEEEITLRLAELAVRVEGSAAAKLLLLNAMTHRSDPRIYETLGTAAFIHQDQQAAVERWEQAITAGSKNPAVIRELALIEGRQWLQEFDESLRLPTEIAARLRTRLLRSIAIEPAQGVSYEMLAWVEAFSETPDPQNINRVIGHLPTMADKKRSLIALAFVMLRVGRPELARTMLDHLATMNVAAADARTLSLLNDRLMADFPQQPPEQTTASRRETPVEASPSAPRLKLPSVGLPEDL